MNNNQISIYFNKDAERYDISYQDITDVRSFIFSERKNIVLKMFDVRNARVLDIGCGPGIFTGELFEKGCEVYGVDASEKMIELAIAKHFKNAHFSVGAIEGLQFPDNHFDAVLCVGVLEYIKDIKKAIEEISRVTKKDGCALFTIPNSSSMLNKLDKIMRKAVATLCRTFRFSFLKSVVDHDYPSSLISSFRLKEILIRNGFVIEAEKFHIFRFSILNKIAPSFSLWLARKFNFVSSKHIGINYIVKCRKS